MTGSRGGRKNDFPATLLPHHPATLGKIHEPGREAGFVREGEGGACAALHGLWERASLSFGAMLSAWLTSGSGARIHHSVARATNLTRFPAPDLSVRVGASRRDPHTARSLTAFQQSH